MQDFFSFFNKILDGFLCDIQLSIVSTFAIL